MSTTPPPEDVYAVLGIRPDAGPRIAREMYWSRIGRYLEADRRGDADARRAIDELNAALAIVLDADLRAEYGAQHGAPEAAPLAQAKQAASRIATTLLAIAAALLLVLAIEIGIALHIWWGVVPVVVALLVVLGRRFIRRRRMVSPATAFQLLRVADGASSEEIGLAYSTRVQELLSRVRFDPVALAELEIVDRAYLRAAESAIQTEPGSRRPWQRVDVVTIAGAGWRGLVAFTASTRSRAREAGGAVSASVRGGARRIAARSSHTRDTAPSTHATASGDDAMRQRLGRAFRDLSTAVAGGTVEAHDTGVPGPDFFLTVPGTGRRVRIAESPIKVGSDAQCDFVLPASAGVGPEHALLWRHGEAVILHVIDASAACFVNDRPLTWAVLDDGDELRIGSVSLRLVGTSAAR